MAERLLGNLEAAEADLENSCQLDYSDDANEALKEILPKVVWCVWACVGGVGATLIRSLSLGIWRR